jgi:hypothetical protein
MKNLIYLLLPTNTHERNNNTHSRNYWDTCNTGNCFWDCWKKRWWRKNKNVVDKTKGNLIATHLRKEENKPKEEQIKELQKQLQENMAPTVEQILDEKYERKQQDKIEEEKAEQETKKSNKEQKKSEEKTKSEFKLWKKTKKVLNRPLEHTWIWKHWVKKSIDWIKKIFKKK